MNGVCTCGSGTVAHNHGCVASCPTNYFYNSTLLICNNACIANTNCQTCLNGDTCAVCGSFGKLYKGTCLTLCPSGTFYESSNNSCP